MQEHKCKELSEGNAINYNQVGIKEGKLFIIDGDDYETIISEIHGVKYCPFCRKEL